jgi:hypothetical protein
VIAQQNTRTSSGTETGSPRRGRIEHRLTRFFRVAACGRWPPRSRVVGLEEGRWTPLRRPDGRLSGRRKTQNVRCNLVHRSEGVCRELG